MTVERWYLENTTSRSAFWAAYIQDVDRGAASPAWKVSVSWGKLGTTGQRKVSGYHTTHRSALAVVQKLMSKKLAGDYKLVSSPTTGNSEPKVKPAVKAKPKREPKPKGPMPDGFIAPRRVRR